MNLLAQGMALEDATTAVEARQRRAAERMERRLLELVARGMTADEIAAVTPGLLVVSSPDGNAAPLSDPSDVTLSAPSVTFFRHCACWEAFATWDFNSSWDPGGGDDAIGIEIYETVNILSSSGTICSSCIVFSPAHEEDFGSVAHTIDDSGSFGRSGSIAMSFRKISSGTHIAVSRYAHTWETTNLELTVGPDGISFTFTSEENQFQRSRQGSPF